MTIFSDFAKPQIYGFFVLLPNYCMNFTNFPFRASRLGLGKPEKAMYVCILDFAETHSILYKLSKLSSWEKATDAPNGAKSTTAATANAVRKKTRKKLFDQLRNAHLCG
jgi:hypothetical protein